MSAYLMDQTDTALLAVYAQRQGIVKNASKCATSLRSANNAALSDRYSDPAQSLRGIAADLTEAAIRLDAGITIAGVFDPDLTRDYIRDVAETYAYQLSEGEYAQRPGYLIVLAIIQSFTA